MKRLSVLLLAVACTDSAATAPIVLPQRCQAGLSTAGTDVPECLALARRISTPVRREADSIFSAALVQRDRYRSDSGQATWEKGSMIDRAIQHVADLYKTGALDDSARFNRLVDHVAVTVAYLRSEVPVYNNRWYPRRTPGLSWTLYDNPAVGIYFQPVGTSQAVVWLRPDGSEPLDTLKLTGDALWRYAVWHESNSVRFPVWEYYLPLVHSGIEIRPPWHSALAQGYALMIFTEVWRRTNDPVWRDRADMTFRSFKVTWDSDGAMLADTTHGYWWEEYHPAIRVWNGSMNALLAVGEYAHDTNDPTAIRMYARGLEAARYYTPYYDTGSWTRYAMIGTLNGLYYHGIHIQIADQLYAQSGDRFFKTTADRWRSYTPPPGTQ